MNEEKQLQQLKKIEINHKEKERDFDKITARVKRKPIHWQVQVVMVAFLVLLCFFTMIQPPKQQVTSDVEQSLIAVYSLQGEGNPYSVWQYEVTKSTNPEFLRYTEEMLASLKPVEKRLEGSELNKTVRLVYSDHSTFLMEEYYKEERYFLYDVEKKQTYEFPTMLDNHVYFLSEADDRNQLFLFLLVIVVLVFMFYLDKKMREAGTKQRSYWQLLVFAVQTLLIIMAIIIIDHVHFFVIVLIIAIGTVINLLLEYTRGQNKWYMYSLLNSAMLALLLLYNIFMNA